MFSSLIIFTTNVLPEKKIQENESYIILVRRNMSVAFNFPVVIDLSFFVILIIFMCSLMKIVVIVVNFPFLAEYIKPTIPFVHVS